MIPQSLLSVANCIRMWCMLSMFSRSTIHSVVFLKSEFAQSSAWTVSVDFLPFTALCAVKLKISSPCHAGLLSATFSKTNWNGTMIKLVYIKHTTIWYFSFYVELDMAFVCLYSLITCYSSKNFHKYYSFYFRFIT